MSLLKSKDPQAPAASTFRFVERDPGPRSRVVRSEDFADSDEDAAASPDARGTSQSLINSSALETQALLTRIAELENALAETSSQQKEACEKAFEAGRAEGINAADKRSGEAIDLLRDGLKTAQSQFAAGLEHQLEIGIALARAIIQQILGDRAQISDHVVNTATRWIEELSPARVIRLQVSAEDFPDAAALAELANLVGPENIERDPALGQGACQFDLQLGRLDASIPIQVRNAMRHLDRAQAGEQL